MTMDTLLVILIFTTLSNTLLIAIILWRSFLKNTDGVERAIREELRSGREESSNAARDLRDEVASGLKTTTDSVINALTKVGESQTNQLEVVTKQIKGFSDSNQTQADTLRTTVDKQLKYLQESNERKLEQIQTTVDEKLQGTLEKRLGESFSLVSERLEAVQRGLGEMQTLATGVGDLKRIFTNVKTRGTWGEIQLGALLEQILIPEQYSRNVQTKSDSQEIVEFAIKLPGQNNDPNMCVWLPVDSKFPVEDYQRIVDASDAADAEALKKAQTAFARSIQSHAKDIRKKYINPPNTTDFAVMFLPMEGLYAEVARDPSLIEDLQHKHRVIISGPTTFAALLNSLQLGFRTLTIEKRSAEVWQILGAVKTEFSKFGETLTKIEKNLRTATTAVEDTKTRTRVMERTLQNVESLPADISSDPFQIRERSVEQYPFGTSETDETSIEF